MLFNSYVFILLFLPVTALGFRLVRQRASLNLAIAWLVLCSFFFYGYWNPIYVPLLAGSILANFLLGRAIGRCEKTNARRGVLALGAGLNLALLGWFKYAHFVAGTVNGLSGSAFSLPAIALPLAISFFTFQQIAYLVDAYQGRIRDESFLDYCLFVSFFPQLIAGPIVHHQEVLPQLRDGKGVSLQADNLSVGITIFILGLFKKVVLADNLAGYANRLFDGALAEGFAPSLGVAWFGLLAYTLQLYFDFSGYSDMAIGLGRMFGIKFPQNFHSPYQALNIAEFWRRWHITLSRFLRDYLYIPLGGNRKGPLRRYGNLMATMLLGGLWHGAGWNFVFWGGLHGLYLCVFHAWDKLARRMGFALPKPFAWGLTFSAVVLGWVFFRAETFTAATTILSSMAGLQGDWSLAGVRNEQLALTLGILAIAVFAPNTQQVMSRFDPCFDWQASAAGGWWDRVRWQPSAALAVVVGCLAMLSLLNLHKAQEFLYFQF